VGEREVGRSEVVGWAKCGLGMTAKGEEGGARE